jgi:hypothetical protein
MDDSLAFRLAMAAAPATDKRAFMTAIKIGRSPEIGIFRTPAGTVCLEGVTPPPIWLLDDHLISF